MRRRKQKILHRKALTIATICSAIVTFGTLGLALYENSQQHAIWPFMTVVGIGFLASLWGYLELELYR